MSALCQTSFVVTDSDLGGLFVVWIVAWYPWPCSSTFYALWIVQTSSVSWLSQLKRLYSLAALKGNAKVLNDTTGNDLLQSISLSTQDYTTALMVFLIAYFIFETPSNYMLKAFRPSRWIALLMFSWGAMTMCLGAATNFGSLTAVRFLLGMFEAGLFPGLVYFLTFWYVQLIIFASTKHLLIIHSLYIGTNPTNVLSVLL